MIFLGVLDNLKKDHVNALAIQLHCQKLFSSYEEMLAKFDQVHPQTALRSAVVIGGWGIYMLSIVPKAYPYTEI